MSENYQEAAYLAEKVELAGTLWNERQEQCAKYGADIPMPHVTVRVDVFVGLARSAHSWMQKKLIPAGKTISFRIMQQLDLGPATTRKLAKAFSYSSGAMARTMIDMAAVGRVMRIDGGEGRGSVALWTLTPASRVALDSASKADTQ